MATKNQTPEATPEVARQPDITPARELLTLDELRAKHRVGRALFAGVCSANNWRPGRAVSEEEFLEAVSKFTQSPMSGSHHNEEGVRK